MPSSLDPLQIDATFPAAGQNNNSQGFRDNFSIIKENLNRAKTELTEVRAEGIYKHQLSGETLNNDMNFTDIFRAQLKAYSETIYDHGSVGLVVNLDFRNGNFQKFNTTNDVGIAFSGFPDVNQVGRMTVWIYCSDPAHSIKLPTTVLYGLGSNFINNREINFPNIGDYLIEFISVNNGVSFWVIGISGLNAFGGPGGSGTTISLPVASTSALGAVRIDGTTIGIANGVISVIGGIPGTSDLRLKTNVQTIESALDTISQLRGVTFDFIQSNEPGLGVIAQEVEQFLPELVHDHNGIKTVDYGKFAGVFIESIKELKNRIEFLESEIIRLENR